MCEPRPFQGVQRCITSCASLFLVSTVNCIGLRDRNDTNHMSRNYKGTRKCLKTLCVLQSPHDVTHEVHNLPSLRPEGAVIRLEFPVLLSDYTAYKHLHFAVSGADSHRVNLHSQFRDRGHIPHDTDAAYMKPRLSLHRSHLLHPPCTCACDHNCP